MLLENSISLHAKEKFPGTLRRSQGRSHAARAKINDPKLLILDEAPAGSTSNCAGIFGAILQR